MVKAYENYGDPPSGDYSYKLEVSRLGESFGKRLGLGGKLQGAEI